MTPQETLRRALLNDEFPEDVAADRLFTPSGEDALRLNRNIALSAWMSQVSGQDINAGSPTWQQDKDALVQGYFKNPTASNVSDEQLHSIVKTHIQTAEEAADIAANIALQGKPSSEALKMLNAKRGPSLVRGVWDRYTKDALNRHFALASKLSPYRGIIDSAASQLGGEMEWSVPTTQKFQEVAKTLLEVPEADRPLVISAIGATGGATPEERASYLSKLAGAMGRMTETMGASTVGTLEQIGTTFEQLGQVPEAIASALSGGVTMQGELTASKARSEEMLKAKENQVAFQILTQQIRQVADSEISPIKGDGWWSQTGIDVARMVPQVAVTVANPTLGTVANLAYFRNTVAAEAKSEDPSLTYEQADAIGSLTAPFNATIETATALIPFGRVKVPLLTKWLSTATTSLRGAARNIALRSAAGAVSEVGEEMAQAIAPLWTQEALSALQKDMPSVDWERRMPDFSKIAAQTWGPALAFGLVAGGAASISEVSSGRLLTSDRDKLIELGVSPVKADEIAAASVAGDWAKTDALIREDGIFTTATPEEMKEAAAANRDEEQRHVAIEEELKRRGELPDVMINPQTGKYRVIDREGNILIETDKRADALNVAYSTLEENQRIAAEATVQIFDELMATRGTQAEGAVVSLRKQTAQSIVQEGIVSYDQMMQGAMTAAQADGVSAQQAKVDSSAIHGFNRVEYWDQVRTMVSRTFAAGVDTAIHETVHARVRRGMANGTYTREMALEWVRAAERALEGKTDKAGKPIKFLPSENDAEIDDRVLEEAVVELAVTDTIGRRKSGTRFTPGLIAKGLAAQARDYKALMIKTNEGLATSRKETAGTISRFKAFLEGWKSAIGNMLRIARQVQAARQEGKLGEDFDAFLDNLLGTDAQSRYDLQTQQEAKQLLEDGKMPFSMNRKGGDLREYSVDAFHGTNSRKFNQFDILNLGKGSGNEGLFSAGFYFSPSSDDAKGYGKNLVAVGLKVKNPLIVPDSFPVMMRGDDSAEYWASFDAQMKSALKSVFSANNFNEVDRVDAVQMDESFVGSFSRAYKALSGVSLPPSKAAEVSANLIQRAGFDAVYAKDGDTTTEIVVYDPFNILVKEWNGKPVESPMFSMGKPSVKTAIEVDGKIHTTTGSHYDATLDYIVRQMPAYQREDMEAAREKAGEILTNEWLKEHGVKQGFVVDGDFLTREETLAKVKGMGIPTPLADEEQRNWFDSQDIEAMQDIRFSSRSMASVLEAALEAQRRNPEFRERLLKLAVEKAQAIRQDGPLRVNKRGVVSQRQGMDTMAENDRTKANIEAERKFRLRSRQRELIDAGMAQLTPETLAAYDQGLTTLEDNPLINSMLNDHGKLMSKTAAQKAGKLRTDGKGNAGDYDDAPRLPIAWYSKSGGIMPDVMAENLGFDSVPAFWEALRSAIYSTRTANEAFQKARAAVRQVEVDALAQATKEANEWAAEAEAKVPTPKDKQLAALRTLDAILSIFPPEIRGKVGGMYQLAKANTDAAREKEILKRVEIIDKVLEKEGVKLYRAKIEKLFKRYAPKKEAGKKPVGQLEPDAQELVDAASEAMGYDEVRMRAEVSAIDSMLAEEGISDERETYLERKRELIQLFADYKNADAARLESAADALEATASEGWAKWKLKKIMERERREEARKSLVADTGKPSIGKERDNQNKWAKTTFGKPFSMLLNISSFSELLRFEFGEKSAEARRLEDQERAAAYAYEDAMQAFGDRIGDFFAELAGGRLAGEQLRFDLAQPTLTVGTGDNERTISQLQGIQALLMWQQEDGRRHMEGQLDESGKPVGSWHYGEEWVKDLESKMTPEAYQVKAFLEQLYSEEYPTLNALYRQRHGVNLPKNPLYSPLTVQPMQAKAGEMVDPVSGFAVTGSILTPGGLRTRNKRAVAEPRFEDAVQIFLGHSRQMEHWKAYYDFAMDAQAILLNREVTNAVESKGSKQAVAVLKKWVDQFAQGGSRDAQAGLEISNTYNRVASRTARIALFGKVATLLIQSVQLAAASVKMPVGSYIKRFGMLMSGNLDYIDAIKSPFMQRRYKSAPPIVQQALADVGDTKRPNIFSSTTPRFLGNLLSGADALFTGGTYAMLLDYHRTVTGPALGLQGAELESFAKAEAERDTEDVAQPVRSGTKSIFENTLPIWARGGFSFASEARQKITLAAWAAYKAKSDPTQAAKVAFLTFIVGGLVTQVIKNLWREAKGDDDEKMWSAERLTKATLAGPLHGIPGVSELMGDPGLFSGFKWSAGAVEKIATKAVEDDLDEVTMRDMENALSAAGYFNDTAAGIAGLSHLGFDFAKILQALAEEE